MRRDYDEILEEIAYEHGTSLLEKEIEVSHLPKTYRSLIVPIINELKKHYPPSTMLNLFEPMKTTKGQHGYLTLINNHLVVVHFEGGLSSKVILSTISIKSIIDVDYDVSPYGSLTGSLAIKYRTETSIKKMNFTSMEEKGAYHFRVVLEDMSDMLNYSPTINSNEYDSKNRLPDKKLPDKKSPVIAWVLFIFLGSFGAHRYYLGKIGSGIAMTLTFGGFGIWTLVDLFLLNSLIREANE